MEYLLPIGFFVLLSAVAGILLTIAGKIFSVKTDETVEKIMEALPGANCGGCGYSGCEGYAQAVAKGEAAPNLCMPGGIETNKALSEIMGVAVTEVERKVAYVRCNGNCDATEDKFVYAGTKSCAAAERFYNGKGTCLYGCAGLGDCVEVCDNNAISVINGVAVVNPSKCSGCGKCVKICPNNVITLKNLSQTLIVTCSSIDSGKITKNACKNGCIACRICEKKCPFDAITVVDNRARINTDKCTSCGLCAQACPTKCITVLRPCSD